MHHKWYREALRRISNYFIDNIVIEEDEQDFKKQYKEIFNSLNLRETFENAYRTMWWDQEIRDSFITIKFEDNKDRRIILYERN